MVADSMERQHRQSRRVQRLGMETHRGAVDVPVPSHGTASVSSDGRLPVLFMRVVLRSLSRHSRGWNRTV